MIRNDTGEVTCLVFHTYGKADGQVILLLHGMLTPYQIWGTAAEAFSRNCRVIVPELDAHTENAPSSFRSIADEAEQLRAYIKANCGGHVFAVCGLSMGGRIAAVLAAFPDIHTDNLVLDGAPLMPLPGILRTVMTSTYRSLIRRSKQRDPKILASCKRDFLPEAYLPYYLKIADNMDEASVGNIIGSVFAPYDFPQYDAACRILFLHGTKGNESLARKAALKLKARNPQTEIRCYAGYAHAQLACFEAEKWTAEVSGFFGV